MMGIRNHLDRVLDEGIDARGRACALFDLFNAIDEPILGSILADLESVDPERYKAMLDFSTSLSDLLDAAESTWGAEKMGGRK